MYHHIQDLAAAKAEGHLGLAVSPENFSTQMNYLSGRGYHPISPGGLIAFFDRGIPLPAKPILLTFDDGYADFYQNAYPVLKTLNYPAVLFLPTGLADNPGYITWNQAREMSGSGLVEIANHTWSHQNLKSNAATDLKEIQTADTQLADRGLDNPKVFAYPYGIIGGFAQKDLQDLGYSLAFSTRYGTVQCFKNRLDLPRVRIGNSALGAYGL
jgi:peptidoglycan/xylan/chitin deacetylase (PgdA/CDA1 family)